VGDVKGDEDRAELYRGEDYLGTKKDGKRKMKGHRGQAN